MRNFFNIEHFKDIKILFYLKFILLVLFLLTGIPQLLYNLGISFFNLDALIISIAIWILSSLVDKNLYFNFYSMIASVSFCYVSIWFMLLWV